MTALEAALELAGQGLRVFPCGADKRPLLRGWPVRAAADAATVRGLWRQWPGVLVGVPTGAVIGSDFLDIDPRRGGDKWLAKVNLPLTIAHQTRSGGWHFRFLHGDGARNSADKIAPGVDVRGDGGYVIWWPAHGLGVVNQGYLAPWPAWLLDLILPKPRLKVVSPSIVADDRYGAEALRSACHRVESAPCGQQEATLNNEAFSIGQLVVAGRLPYWTAFNALLAAGALMPNYRPRDRWTDRRLREKIERAFADASRCPRRAS